MVIGITLAATGAQIWAAWFVLALMCVYISAYAWSWGPLGWLYSRSGLELCSSSACVVVHMLTCGAVVSIGFLNSTKVMQRPKSCSQVALEGHLPPSRFCQKPIRAPELTPVCAMGRQRGAAAGDTVGWAVHNNPRQPHVLLCDWPGELFYN